MGRIDRGKGIIYLLLAAAEIARMPSLAGRVEFALVGNGDAALVHRMLHSLRLQDIVTLRGMLPYASMPQVQASADVFVLPSIPTPHWEEQFGLVLAESMACGQAVVSTHSGAIPEVVGDAGLLVPPCDHRALADAIACLLLDDSTRAQLGARAAARAREQFDANVFAARLYEIYEGLLA